MILKSGRMCESLASQSTLHLYSAHPAISFPYLSIIINKGQSDLAIGSHVLSGQRGTDPPLRYICEPALSALDIGIQRHLSKARSSLGGWGIDTLDIKDKNHQVRGHEGRSQEVK